MLPCLPRPSRVRSTCFGRGTRRPCYDQLLIEPFWEATYAGRPISEDVFPMKSGSVAIPTGFLTLSTFCPPLNIAGSEAYLILKQRPIWFHDQRIGEWQKRAPAAVVD